MISTDLGQSVVKRSLNSITRFVAQRTIRFAQFIDALRNASNDEKETGKD